MKRLKEVIFKEVPHILCDVSKCKNPRFFYKLDNQSRVIVSLKTDTTLKSQNERPFTARVLNPSYKISKNVFVEEVINQIQDGTFCELIPENNTNRILVEYSSPNIAKPFHVGHFRSTLLGHFVSNILSDTNREVIRMNYLGDWGTQFGLVLAGLGATMDNVDEAKRNLTSFGCNLNNPSWIEKCDSGFVVKQICDAYVRANQDPDSMRIARDLTAAMEVGKACEAVDLWQAIRKVSVHHLQETYKLLGIQFDKFMYESDFSKTQYSSALNLLLSLGLAKETDGQMVLCDSGLPLGRSDGASLYLGRDIASALFRIQNFNPTSMIYVIDKSQQNHITALLNSISKIQDIEAHHIAFGKITGMSTRTGKGALLADILDECYERMAEQQRKTATTRDMQDSSTRTLALSNLIIYLLRQRRLRDFNFSWDGAIEGSGDCGSRLQYCHSRLTSLEQHSGVSASSNTLPDIIQQDPIAVQLIIIMANYEDVINTCVDTMESSHAVKYAFQLCHCISKCLKTHQVKGQEILVAEQRMLLFSSAKKVLAKVMKVLGVQPLDQM